ncbi:MAG TPA: TIGR02449 family protein [Gammaproteobacteria bacterium]|nr:TIGR02449 family protein [Gammaproteobacteria bacterium]
MAGFTAEIGELLDLFEKLRAENERLRNLNARLQTEKAQLLRRNQLSQDKIEGMITRLKTMELEL